MQPERHYMAGGRKAQLMKKLRSCGVLIFRQQPEPWFLLMKHPDRWDLPKGHVDPGESDLQCALREMEEETGIHRAQVQIDAGFQFVESYTVNYKRTGGKPQQKTLVIFLAKLLQETEIILTEHTGYEWRKWEPPHDIQQNTINPLLQKLAEYWKAR